MVDPHVHFHVIPRYRSSRKFLNMEFKDDYWPKPANLSGNIGLSDKQMKQLGDFLSDNWLKTIKSS